MPSPTVFAGGWGGQQVDGAPGGRGGRSPWMGLIDGAPWTGRGPNGARVRSRVLVRLHVWRFRKMLIGIEVCLIFFGVVKVKFDGFLVLFSMWEIVFSWWESLAPSMLFFSFQFV